MPAKRWAAFARLGGVGDCLVAASVARPLKKLGYAIEVITSDKDPHTVFRNNPFIDKISVKADGDIPGGADWQAWFRSRAKEYDIFANLSHSMEAHHAFFVGSTQFWWPQDFRRKIAAGSYLETAHDVMGVPHIFGPLFFPTDDERDHANKHVRDKAGGRFVAWVISGSRIDKIYFPAAMAIARIIKEIGIPVVIFGVGDKQAEMATAIRDHVTRQNGTRDMLYLAVQDLQPPEVRWPLRTALTAVMAADLVVTPDTGMWWAVAMENMPKVLMVSHASVENIAKHSINTLTLHADQMRVSCHPCHRLHDTIDTCTPNRDGGHGAACMADISVECVVQAVKAGLGDSKAHDILRSDFPTNASGIEQFGRP